MQAFYGLAGRVVDCHMGSDVISESDKTGLLWFSWPSRSACCCLCATNLEGSQGQRQHCDVVFSQLYLLINRGGSSLAPRIEDVV
jgi:hypothetical protein